MIEKYGNLWDFHKMDKWIVITTNGTIKGNGQAVMGRGIALQCAQMYPEFPKMLGDWLRQGGNHVRAFVGYHIITFPVKHDWWEKADIKLIEQSCMELLDISASPIYMPRPGCGNGQLAWAKVKPILEKHLYFDSYIVVERIRT